ncbi:MAG: hypothetical protein AAGF79_03825 [Pseudomonadota bacterium]
MTTQDDLQGLWKRAWIKAPTQAPTFEDHTTRVYWAQSGALYADLRIPLDRGLPTGARTLADLDAATMLRLMQAEGFAGTTSVIDGVCTWAREINWHGQPDDVDAGQMWFDGADLIEDGVHGDYREVWLREPTPPLTAVRATCDRLSGILVRSERMFLLGLGHPDAPATAPLVAALEAGVIPDELPAHFETEYVFGHWDGARGIADLCTNPFREGHCVLEHLGDGWSRHHAGFDGDVITSPLTLSEP